MRPRRRRPDLDRQVPRKRDERINEEIRAQRVRLVDEKGGQVGILPTKEGGQPSWGAKPFPKGARSGRFVTLASGIANDNDALPIRADARVVGATLKAGESAEYRLGAGRHGYLVPAAGAIEVNGVRVNARDGAAIADVEVLTVTALEDSEIVLVDAA